MRTNRIKFVVLVAFALALLAGAAAGMLAARFSAAPAQSASTENLTLSEELQLTADQRDQIRQIWEGMRGEADDCYRQAQQLDQQRQDRLLELLTKEQKERYDHIYSAYVDQYTALTAKRQAAFNRAIDRTKQLLTEQQRRRYEAILSRRLGHGTAGGLGADHPTPPLTPSTQPLLDPPG